MTQIEKIAGGSYARLYRSRAEDARQETKSFISRAAPSSAGKRKNRDRRKFFHLPKQLLASSTFVAQYINQHSPAGGHTTRVSELRQQGTLAYIGADMLPELLAEMRTPRQFDGKL
jgi:hypothetical protein